MNKENPDQKLHIVMFLDLICEWCYLGNGIINYMKEKYPINIDYLFMEIHPDAPIHGMPMNWHLEEPKLFYEELNALGESYGIHFFEREVFSNTHSALRVAEYALAHGKGEAFLREIWSLYMQQGKNISNPDIIMEALLKTGLPPISLDRALTQPIWEQKLLMNAKANDLSGFNGNVPAYIVNGKFALSGAQSAEIWEEVFELALHDQNKNRN